MVCATRSFVDVRTRSEEAVLRELATATAFRTIEPILCIDAPHRAFRLEPAPVAFAQFARQNTDIASRVAEILAARGSAHAAGLAHLMLGDWDRAIDRLQGVDALDLAAAYYMRGLATRSLNDFARALQQLAAAEPTAQVLFNRALIIEQLRDREAAAHAWRAYLRVAPDSAWGAEARAHLKSTTAPSATLEWSRVKPLVLAAATDGDVQRVEALTDPFRVSTRKMLETELLPGWAEATLRGDGHSSASRLVAVRTVTAALAKRTGETLFVDAVTEIEATAGRPGGAIDLARAYVAYAEGRVAIESNDYARAGRKFEDAARLAANRRGPAAALIAVQLVMARYYSYEFDAALRLAVETTERFVENRERYVAVFAHLTGLRGMLVTVGGNPSEGIRLFEAALAAYQRLGEREIEATYHTNLADTFQYVGESERAAVHRYHALQIAEQLDEPRRLHPILTEAADAALAGSCPAAALAFHDRLVRLAYRSGESMQIADALVTRSTSLRRNGMRADALRDISEAVRVAQRISDLPTRQRALADAGAAEGFAYLESDDRRAIPALSAPIAFFRQIGFRLQLAQLLLERGRAKARLGDATGAESDFRDGIAELEQQRRRIDEAELRISYFDRAEMLFTDLAQSLLRRGHTVAALDVLERSRARELLDATTRQPMQPLKTAEIQRRLAPDTVILEYTVTRRGLIVAAISHDTVWLIEREGGESTLRPLAEAVNAGFDSSAGLPGDALRDLAHELLGGVPLAPRIIFVPDPLLNRLPFAALPDAQGRYLVERHTIGVAPSATLAVRNAERDCALADVPASVLLVASPEQPAGYTALSPLPETTVETEKVSKLYPTSRILTGPAVRVDDVLRAGRSYSVLHFAGHSVVDHHNPAASVLLIGEQGRLSVADIEAARLTRSRLVVLSACSTSIGKSPRGEGALSLARAFMAASVPSVLGTIAKVEDAPTGKLLTAFHQHYVRSADPATALRAAQLQMLRSRDGALSDPAAWAAFQVIGGAAASCR